VDDQSISDRPTHPETRFLTSGVEVEIEEPSSDSEYDSDVIVVGKGRKCPPISETPPNHAPSAMRMLPAPPSSPLPQGSPVPPPEKLNGDPGLLEWYPHQIHTSCPLAIEVQKLRAQVGHLELEATRYILFYLFIYFISFNVIQPMWLCRQILTHKIADMSERRKQANKQKKTKQHT
jgi:hypothetical protein